MTEWREYQRDSELSEMAEHYEKVRCDVCRLACRPGIRWRVPDTFLEEHAFGVLFCITPGALLITIFSALRLTLVTDHE